MVFVYLTFLEGKIVGIAAAIVIVVALGFAPDTVDKRETICTW